MKKPLLGNQSGSFVKHNSGLQKSSKQQNPVLFPLLCDKKKPATIMSTSKPVIVVTWMKVRSNANSKKWMVSEFMSSPTNKTVGRSKKALGGMGTNITPKPIFFCCFFFNSSLVFTRKQQESMAFWRHTTS